MITWIRWNLTKIIVGIVAVAVIAGGLYASGTLRQAKDANQAATVVDRIYDCETPECIKEIAAAYDADQLVALMSEVSSTNTAEVTQSTALRDSGGRCIIFGKAVGELYAELVTVKEIPTLIASIDMTPSDKGTSLAYRCQMGFVSSVGAALGKTLSVEEVTKALPTLCDAPSQADAGKSRYRFETLDAICQLSATGHLVVQSVLTENDKATWKDFVNLCNAAGEFRVSQCLMAAQGAVRQAGLEDMVYGEDDCKESTRPAFCTMIATDAQVGKKMADIVRWRSSALGPPTPPAAAKGSMSGCGGCWATPRVTRWVNSRRSASTRHSLVKQYYGPCSPTSREATSGLRSVLLTTSSHVVRRSSTTSSTTRSPMAWYRRNSAGPALVSRETD
jgi:hypothetical protein